MRIGCVAMLLVLGCFVDAGSSSPPDAGSSGNGSVPVDLDTDATDDEGSSGSAGAGESGDAQTPPEIAMLSASAPDLRPDRSVTVVAVVTDPDGSDDVMGGTLHGSDPALAYGVFEPTGEGVFELTISWDDAYALEGFSFEGVGEIPLTATFRDHGGATADRGLTLALACGGELDAPAVCAAGECTDLASDLDNCSSCGTACPLQAQGSSLAAGGCGGDGCLPVWDECVLASDGFADCDEYCADKGQACAPACGEAGARATFTSAASCEDLTATNPNPLCDLDFDFGGSPPFVYRCCCV